MEYYININFLNTANLTTNKLQMKFSNVFVSK